ncbi:hypothetical protein [Pseudomonas amygdali]|uniref:Uncharacterized protein n=2 Tax=Pseudomonas amygdali pv. lachrymans TaxID=53707 RepID=A0AAD0PWC1_PSEAV|nr:hypothetical protein [Pseudomonas amygdali]AXH59968.1 hypothetical protein PLA107_032600 [Pseudomonas amygdali pv. lachrymans str. M301315]RMT05764.1 hypothetical protein ALP54_03828 [Pseudomonas amygdali pv. lachrymans]
MKKKMTGISAAFAADPEGTLVELLRQPIEALVDLAQLREDFDYKTITDAMTQAMAHTSLKHRYLGVEWDSQCEMLKHLPQHALTLLIMPAILNLQVGLLRPLSGAVMNNYVAKEPLEHIDIYLFRDNDVYRAADAIGSSSKMKGVFLNRLEACREAALFVTPQVLQGCLASPLGCLFHDAWTNYATSSHWYRKSVGFDLGNTNPIAITITHQLLLEGPEGPHAWAYPKSLKKITDPQMGTKTDLYLKLLDGFFSCKEAEKLHSSPEALRKIYLQLYQRLTPLKKNGEVNPNNEWIVYAIREFHRQFFVPGNGFVEQMRANPEAYTSMMSSALNLVTQPKSAQNLGLMAEFASALNGSGPLFKAGQGTMVDSLAQLGNLPIENTRNPEQGYDKLREYLDNLFKGASNAEKISQALDKVESSQQARLFSRIWPEAVKRHRNPWLQDQRMQQDLGL